MDKVTIEMVHCYGIKSLMETLDFSENRAYAIYAPNGVMKPSFAQAFHDLALGVESKDRIYSD